MLGEISIATIIIIALNVIVSMKGFNDAGFFERYKFNTAAILRGKQYDRLLTSGFLHADMTHLIFNMLTLYFFAGAVIIFFAAPSYFITGIPGIPHLQIGTIMFVFVYILAIIGGNILALFFHKDNPYYSAVGASGGVSGILFASIAVNPHMTLVIMFVIPMKAWIFGILYLGYSVYGVQKQLGNIGHSAHLGGALVGLLATIIYYPDVFQKNQIYILGMLIPIAILLILSVKNKA